GPGRIARPTRSCSSGARRSSLGGQRPGIARAELDPPLELAFALDVLRVDPEPARHLAAAHLHRVRLRRPDQLIRLIGVDANEQPALAARGNRHVPADEEAETAEHLLLAQIRLVADELADALGEGLVVRHEGIVLPGRPFTGSAGTITLAACGRDELPPLPRPSHGLPPAAPPRERRPRSSAVTCTRPPTSC